jgi:hypothetical protein
MANPVGCKYSASTLELARLGDLFKTRALARHKSELLNLGGRPLWIYRIVPRDRVATRESWVEKAITETP